MRKSSFVQNRKSIARKITQPGRALSVPKRKKFVWYHTWTHKEKLDQTVKKKIWLKEKLSE